MRTLEIKMQLTPPNLFERFAGVRCGFETMITDGQLELVGRGPTPEASHEAAHIGYDAREESPLGVNHSSEEVMRF